jgi:hypothetical protein
MIPHVAAFVDAGYLRRGCERCLGLPAGTARIDARALVEWLNTLASTLPALQGHRMLRTFWYDGALVPGHPQYQRQQTYFGALADTPGLRLRLGHMQPRARPGNPLCCGSPSRVAGRRLRCRCRRPKGDPVRHLTRAWSSVWTRGRSLRGSGVCPAPRCGVVAPVRVARSRRAGRRRRLSGSGPPSGRVDASCRD